MTRVASVLLFSLVAFVAACGEPIGPPADADDPVAADRRSGGEVVRAFRYEGCGAEFGTCAAVIVAAEPLGDGFWRLRGTIENRSWQASQQLRRNSMIVFARLGEFGPGLWNGYSEFDCGGCNDDGSPGQRLNVVWASFSGPLDERCARNNRCSALSLVDFTIPGPSEFPFPVPAEVEFEYMSEPVWFDLTIHLGEWDPRAAVIHVSQFFVGGRAFPDASLSALGVSDGGFGGDLEEYLLRYRRMDWLTLPDPLLAATGAQVRAPRQGGLDRSSFDRSVRAAKALLGAGLQ